METENKWLPGFGDGGKVWLQRDLGDVLGWSNYSVSLLWWQLHSCMHLSEFTDLYIKKSKFYSIYILMWGLKTIHTVALEGKDPGFFFVLIPHIEWVNEYAYFKWIFSVSGHSKISVVRTLLYSWDQLDLFSLPEVSFFFNTHGKEINKRDHSLKHPQGTPQNCFVSCNKGRFYFITSLHK